jgi:hypothetical protein
MPNFGQKASLKVTTRREKDQGKIKLLKWIINKLLTSYRIRRNGHILRTDKKQTAKEGSEHKIKREMSNRKT